MKVSWKKFRNCVNKAIEKLPQLVWLPSRYTLLILALWAIFHIPIEDFLIRILVGPILSKVEASWFLDVLYWTSVLGMLWWFLFRFDRFIPSRLYYNASIFFSGLFAYYAIFSSRFVFLAPDWSCLPYLSLVLLPLVLTIATFCSRSQNRRQEEAIPGDKSALISDSPLGIGRPDRLSYANYSKEVTKLIAESGFDQAFAIGINGKWGSGKTSFIDLIKRNFNEKDDQILVIDFNPWASHSPAAIIEDFFQHLYQSFKPYHSQLANSLRQYSRDLISSEITGVQEVARILHSLFIKDDSLENQLKRINEQLSRIDKKLVIVIDDLDRLDPNEIFEVLKLIRNTANFRNTFFLVAYDRDYLVNTLGDNLPFRKETFLEKIFQLEITVPHFPRKALLSTLVEILNGKVDSVLIDTIVREWDRMERGKVIYLHTIRDVTRLANGLILHAKLIQKEVNLRDYFLLEILRVKYPSVHALLFYQRKKIFRIKKTDGPGKRQYYFIITKGSYQEESRGYLGSIVAQEPYLEPELNSNFQLYSLTKDDAEKALSLVGYIFSDAYSSGDAEHLSVRYIRQYDRYFSYSVWKDRISETAFLNALSYEEEALINQFERWINDGKKGDLFERLSTLNSFKSSDEYHKILKAMVYASNFDLKIPRRLDSSIEDWKGYDIEEFRRKIENAPFDLQVKRYILMDLLNPYASDYYFQSHFIQTVVSDFNSNVASFPLTKEELKNYGILFFQKLCEEEINLSRQIYTYFHLNKYQDFHEIEGRSGTVEIREYYPPEILESMRNFIKEKDLMGFIKHTTERKLNLNEFRLSEDLVIVLWEDIDNFLAFLSSSGSLPEAVVEEYKRFVEKVKASPNSRYVEFDFQAIKFDE